MKWGHGATVSCPVALGSTKMADYNDPEQNEYDDDEYNYYPEENYGWNYKFDMQAWEKWLKQAIEDIIQEDENTWVVQPKKFPVSDSTPQDTSKQTYFMYLGSNHYQEAIWTKEYFISDEVNILWKNHISSNAAHYLKQPNYYRGLYNILN
tara:strand:+ start:372 stop:824 length:453 start_codon:yes stop_codon:yes gene_type:complete